MNLEELISQDYELEGHGNWLRAKDHDSLVIDVKKQLFYWNSQGISGDSFIWLTKIKGFSYDAAKEFLKKNDQKTLYSFIHNVQNLQEVVVYPKLVDVFFEEGLNNRDYWYRRGISDTTIHRFRLGHHDGWFTIPFYQDGLFRDFQMRRDIPSKQIKHYYKGIGRLLFNSDILRITDTVFICEGPTDCLRLIQEGLPAVSHNAGSEGWDDNWFKYFISQKEIIIVYDNDKAGVNGAKIVAQNLGSLRSRIYTFDGFEPKYDIVDFFNDGGKINEFKDLICNESKYIFELPGKEVKQYAGKQYNK